MDKHKYFIEDVWGMAELKQFKNQPEEGITELHGKAYGEDMFKVVGYVFHPETWPVTRVNDWLVIRELEPDKLMEAWNTPSGAAKSLYFSGSGATVAGSVQINGQGVTIQRFKKDMIATGQYTHPTKGWNLQVTEGKMDDWIKAFNRMKEQGVDVEVVVDHSNKAEDVKGYLVDMYREDDTLFGVHEMIGQDAIDLVQKVKNVSVLIDPNFRDGKKHSYGEAIVHSAIVQQPVVPGQSAFEPIAASMAAGNIQCYHFNKETEQMIDFKKLAESLGVDTEITEANLTESILGVIDPLKTQTTEFETKLAEMQTKLDAKTEKLAASKLTPELQEQMGVTANDALDNLVAVGKLTPAACIKAKELFIGETDGRNVMALSLREDKKPSFFSNLCEVLKANNPADLKELTPGQRKALSRETPGDEEAQGASKEVKDELVDAAG